jgi:hypothetical protein
MFDPKEVTNLLDDIRSASNSLLNLVKPQAGNRLDVKARLEAVRTPVVKLLDIQAQHREEVKQIIPHFAPSLREAYDAVSEAGAAIDPKKHPDLDQLAQEINSLLRSLDESPPFRE